jgi:hypothetical protein
LIVEMLWPTMSWNSRDPDALRVDAPARLLLAASLGALRAVAALAHRESE